MTLLFVILEILELFIKNMFNILYTVQVYQ
jgi:hypothetical protein